MTRKDTSEDYIRRSDVGLTDFEIIMCNGDYREALKIVLEKIAKAPSVELQEPKIGHWIATGRMFVELTGEQTVYEVICDQCKGLSYFRRVTSVLFGADYCPHCGAKMEVINDV